MLHALSWKQTKTAPGRTQQYAGVPPSPHVGVASSKSIARAWQERKSDSRSRRGCLHEARHRDARSRWRTPRHRPRRQRIPFSPRPSPLRAAGCVVNVWSESHQQSPLACSCASAVYQQISPPCLASGGAGPERVMSVTGPLDLAMRSPGDCDGWCICCRKRGALCCQASTRPWQRVCNSDRISLTLTAVFAPGAEATRLISLLPWLRGLTCRLVHDESSARVVAFRRVPSFVDLFWVRYPRRT